MRSPLKNSVTVAVLLTVVFGVRLRADDLWLAVASEQPGVLRVSEGGTVPRVAFVREAVPNRAYPTAIMKVAQIAVGPDGNVYYCSGLDGSLMHLLRGEHEIQSLEVDGQIRDVACTGEEHVVYYSVVATPQEGQPLSDGFIYRRDFWAGTAELVATVRQAEVGNNWWGTFTIRDGSIYLATLGSPSSIYRWNHGQVERTFDANRFDIRGLSTAPDGKFLFVDGGHQVWETLSFDDARPILDTELQLSDVGVRASSESRRP